MTSIVHNAGVSKASGSEYENGLSNARAISSDAVKLYTAATSANKGAIGKDQADAFKQALLPILLDSAAGLWGIDQNQKNAIEKVLEKAVDGSGSESATLGLKQKADGTIGIDSDYPPRAANALMDQVLGVLGFDGQTIKEVTDLNRTIGAVAPDEGKYAPSLQKLPENVQNIATRVSKSLIGKSVTPPLTKVEKAFLANLVLNNLMWHMTNWQKAATDPTRGNPSARQNVFNTYVDNLKKAFERGGLAAVIDMAISASHNAGKPGVGKANFAQQFDSRQAPQGYETKVGPNAGNVANPEPVTFKFNLGNLNTEMNGVNFQVVRDLVILASMTKAKAKRLELYQQAFAPPDSFEGIRTIASKPREGTKPLSVQELIAVVNYHPAFSLDSDQDMKQRVLNDLRINLSPENTSSST